MRFQKEINIFAKDAILKRFQTNETNFSVVKGKIEALISESEILELQNSKVTMYSKLVDVKLTVDGLEQTYTDITSKYDAVSGKYTDLDAKVAEYKSGVDGMSQNLSQVQTNLRDNYSTTATMNATIQAKIDGLSSTISQTYATGSDVQQKLASADATAKGYADAAKQEAVDTAQASTKELLKSYATVTKTQSMIDQKATSIESTVSSTYATKDSVGELQTWKTEASQKITDSAIISTITSSTEWTKKADANTVSKLETRVEQTETDITSKVSKSSISSEINQTAQDVKISASKINFNGLVTANNYFKINKNGSMEAISGKIGGWTIGSKYGITNRNSINIEICVNPETDYYKAVDKAEQLAAQLLKQYGWGTDRLKRHYDVSRKNCPRRIQAEGRWPEFVKKTAAYMKGATTVKNTTTKNTVTLSDKIEVQFPVIQKGSKGTAVSMLQAVLGVKVDGDFGNDTETSLKAFQKNVKLTADGICGKDTWTKVIEHMKANT